MEAPPRGRARPRCAVLARALDEPLAGTAPIAGRWICLEEPTSWAPDVAADPGVVGDLARRAAQAGWRLLLIRRPGRRPAATDQRRRVLLADTTPERPVLTRLEVDDLATLRLPVDDEPLPGEPLTEPLLLVCTHGRRDRCCAIDGRALITSVTAGCPELTPYVWESSHLGGHRFAPTALVLPTGYLYGRLDPATAVDVLKAAAHGEMEPLLCRGRSTWTPEGQVAELAVRRATGLREAAALRVRTLGAVLAPPGDDGPPHDPVPSARATAGDRRAVTEVLVRASDGRRWVVAVEETAPADPRPTSCGADPEPVAGLRAGPVRALTPTPV